MPQMHVCASQTNRWCIHLIWNLCNNGIATSKAKVEVGESTASSTCEGAGGEILRGSINDVGRRNYWPHDPSETVFLVPKMFLF